MSEVLPSFELLYKFAILNWKRPATWEKKVQVFRAHLHYKFSLMKLLHFIFLVVSKTFLTKFQPGNALSTFLKLWPANLSLKVLIKEVLVKKKKSVI